MNPTLPKQSGFTIVEIMVALVLSLILTGGVIQVFVANKQTYRLEEGLSRSQENARYAMGYMQREIRMAGYFGCNQTTGLYNILANVEKTYNVDVNTPIKGHEATTATTWSPALPAGLTSGTTAGDVVRPGTDFVVLRRIADNGISLDKEMPDSSATIFVVENLPNPPIATDDVVIISDCSKSTLFYITNYTNSSGGIQHNKGNAAVGNKQKELQAPGVPGYGTDASIFAPQTRTFFVGSDNDGDPVLRMKLNNAASTIIAEGVENIQLLYGVDTDDDTIANRYYGADSINDSGGASPTWDEVVSTRLGLLIQSPNPALDANDSGTYNVLDESIAATGGTINHGADRRLRYVASSTIKIRNRGN